MLSVSSTAFADGGAIPQRNTCDGKGLSPALAWTGVPPGTDTMAVIVTDPDAHGFVHWLAADLAPGHGSPGGLAEGASGTSAAAVEGCNGFGDAGYGAPCPSVGSHRYIFEVFALSTPLRLEPGFTEDALRRRMREVTIAYGTVMGRYGAATQRQEAEADSSRWPRRMAPRGQAPSA